MKFFLVGLVRVYQWCISPFFPASCKFDPTCSEYMAEAIKLHGVFKGGWLGLKRIGKCHPLSKAHGYDPVPKKKDSQC